MAGGEGQGQDGTVTDSRKVTSDRETMHGRRAVGAAGLMKAHQTRAAAEKVGAQVVGDDMKHLEEQMALFKSSLEEFARKHKAAINKDPEFRRQFQQMTSSIGARAGGG